MVAGGVPTLTPGFALSFPAPHEKIETIALWCQKKAKQPIEEDEEEKPAEVAEELEQSYDVSHPFLIYQCGDELCEGENNIRIKGFTSLQDVLSKGTAKLWKKAGAGGLQFSNSLKLLLQGILKAFFALDKLNVPIQDLSPERIFSSLEDHGYDYPKIFAAKVVENKHQCNFLKIEGLIRHILVLYIRSCGEAHKFSHDVQSFLTYLKKDRNWMDVFGHPAFWAEGDGMLYCTNLIFQRASTKKSIIPGKKSSMI